MTGCFQTWRFFFFFFAGADFAVVDEAVAPLLCAGTRTEAAEKLSHKRAATGRGGRSTLTEQRGHYAPGADAFERKSKETSVRSEEEH